MQRLIVLLLLLATLVPAAGCGGPMSQADMRARALKRTKDPEEQTAAARPQTPASSDSEEAAWAAEPLPAATAATLPGDAAAAPIEPAAQPQPPERPVGDAGLPLTESQRRQRSIDNLQRIAAALEQYAAEQHMYPHAAAPNQPGQAPLSWRVRLLPYLGYHELYARFRHHESWDSPHNRSLLAAIPAEYQSPERSDEKTNYLLPVGSGTAFPGYPVLISRIEDGPANTVVLLEVDDEAAVPWTQPADYAWDARAPGRRLGALRGGVFFLVWGGGSVGQCTLEAARPHWRAMFCIDDGEAFTAGMVHQPPLAEPQSLASVQPEQAVPPPIEQSPVAVTIGGQAEPRSPAGRQPPAATPAARLPLHPPRAALPSESARQIARELLRQTYQQQYEQASAEQRRKLARQLLTHASLLENEGADRYVALELCWRMAVEAGDLDLALQAAEQIAAAYAVNRLEVTATVLDATTRSKLPAAQNDTVLQVATESIDQALAADQFPLARRLYRAAIAAARRNGQRQVIATVSARQQKITLAEEGFATTAAALEDLARDPADTRACGIAGRYYCLVKQRWDDGLPLLAQGDDEHLAALARAELSRPAATARQLALADAWWSLGESRREYRDALRARAAFWYAQALPSLPSGLDQLRAQMRLDQAGAETL